MKIGGPLHETLIRPAIAQHFDVRQRERDPLVHVRFPTVAGAWSPREESFRGGCCS